MCKLVPHMPQPDQPIQIRFPAGNGTPSGSRLPPHVVNCKNARIPVWGLEALTLSGRGIQPHEAHTLWFQKESAENWDTALAFLSREENQDFLYELYIGDVD